MDLPALYYKYFVNIFKQLLDEVFVIPGIIKVKVSRSYQPKPKKPSR